MSMWNLDVILKDKITGTSVTVQPEERMAQKRRKWGGG